MSTAAPALPTAELAAHLSGTPGSKVRFGTTAAEVLQTCFWVSAAQESWDKSTILTFLEQEDLNPKVWDKLVAIARSTNLSALPQKDILPASYTALYALVVMSDEEFSAAVAEKDLVTAGASSRSLLDWTKAYRLRGTGIGKEVPLTLVLPDDLTPQQHKILLNALKETAAEFGAQVLEGKGGLKQAEVKAEARKAVADRIDEELMRLLGPVVLSAPEDLKSKFEVRSAAELITGRRDAFTGFLQVLEGKVQEVFWRKYGRTYCLKIARDFNLTDSRTDRFQLKDRLKKAVKSWDKEIEGFGAMVAEIQSTYMK